MRAQAAAEAFSLRLRTQHWLREDSADADLCSHGSFAISIGGVVVAEGNEDYGVSETALALLRTLEREHDAAAPAGARSRVAERPVFHGCGTILMLGCPIGVDWSVRHEADLIRLNHVTVQPTTNERDAVILADAQATVAVAHYRAEVLSFAEEARAYFRESTPKVFQDDFGRQQHVAFWREFDDIIDRHRAVQPDKQHGSMAPGSPNLDSRPALPPEAAWTRLRAPTPVADEQGPAGCTFPGTPPSPGGSVTERRS